MSEKAKETKLNDNRPLNDCNNFLTHYLNINYEIKNQLKLFIGERSKTVFDSGCKMFDLFLKEPYQFDQIVFQNFYTAYLTIKAKEKYTSNKNEWKILVKRMKLMESIHGETGANQIFTISKDMMLDKDLKNITQLRFILQQPSAYWKDFGIDEIKLKLANPDLSLDKAIDDFSKKCEKVKKLTFEKMPPIDNISNRLQNLWSLCYEASIQKKSELEDNDSFEIDGNYEVKLLSYSNSNTLLDNTSSSNVSSKNSKSE